MLLCVINAFPLFSAELNIDSEKDRQQARVQNIRDFMSSSRFSCFREGASGHYHCRYNAFVDEFDAVRDDKDAFNDLMASEFAILKKSYNDLDVLFVIDAELNNLNCVIETSIFADFMPNPATLKFVFCKAAIKGDVGLMNKLITGTDVYRMASRWAYKKAFVNAIIGGHMHVVQYLLSLENELFNMCQRTIDVAFIKADKHWQYPMMDFLLSDESGFVLPGQRGINGAFYSILSDILDVINICSYIHHKSRVDLETHYYSRPSHNKVIRFLKEELEKSNVEHEDAITPFISLLETRAKSLLMSAERKNALVPDQKVVNDVFVKCVNESLTLATYISVKLDIVPDQDGVNKMFLKAAQYRYLNFIESFFEGGASLDQIGVDASFVASFEHSSLNESLTHLLCSKKGGSATPSQDAANKVLIRLATKSSDQSPAEMDFLLAHHEGIPYPSTEGFNRAFEVAKELENVDSMEYILAHNGTMAGQLRSRTIRLEHSLANGARNISNRLRNVFKIPTHYATTGLRQAYCLDEDYNTDSDEESFLNEQEDYSF